MTKNILIAGAAAAAFATASVGVAQNDTSATDAQMNATTTSGATTNDPAMNNANSADAGITSGAGSVDAEMTSGAASDYRAAGDRG